MMTATEAEIIKVLAEEKNMRKAAERLFLTQPALSQRLQSIEKEWGTQLFITFATRINSQHLLESLLFNMRLSNDY